MVNSWSAHSRGKGSNGEGAQPPRFGRQTPRWGDWPSCGDPQFQGRLFVPQSWVCLITGIELNVLFVRFPADTRHQLRDERPLLPPAQHPTASSPDLPLERLLSPPTEAPGGYQGTGSPKVAFGPPSLQEFSLKWGHGPQRIMALWMWSRVGCIAGGSPCQEWGCGHTLGCVPESPCSCVPWGWAGWRMKRDLCICRWLLPKEPPTPASCHTLLLQLSITQGLSHPS